MFYTFFRFEEGQGLVEYALLLTLIAVVVVGMLSIMGVQLSGVFAGVAEVFDPQVSEVFSEINSGLEGPP